MAEISALRCVQAKQTRVQKEGGNRMSVKVQKKEIQKELNPKTNSNAQTEKQYQKLEIPVGEFLYRIGQGWPTGHRPWWRREKGGLERRQECISTSLSFACKTRERLNSVLASNPTRTGAGAWEQRLGHALLSPCPLWPCCQEGETEREEREESRERKHEVTKKLYETHIPKI